MKPADIIINPERAKEVPAADLPQFITSLVTLRERVEIAYYALTARVPAIYNGTEFPPAPSKGDRLLTAAEAASLLGLTESQVSRRRWPFRRKIGHKTVRYSERGIQRHLSKGGPQT